MSQRTELAIVAAVAAGLATAAPPDARACGPDFDIELLSQRVATLDQLEDGVFIDEVARLVPPPPRPYLVMAGRDGAVDAMAEGAAERALYAVGANAFSLGDRDTAERAFEQLLALPPAARRQRSTWAAYMLGRLRDGDAAIAAYQQVRALVDAGFVDDGGLAASSLGQEARLHADQVATVRLYAEQAAHGHPDGATSLLFVVRALIERGAETEIIGDPVGQRLLATYLDARSDELDDAERARVWSALLAVGELAGADRLAAAAYRRGEWELARRLVERADDSTVARRVRAKLALRAGDTDRAERLLASIDDGSAARICGERAVLAMGDGRFVDAMSRAWAMRATYPDALYLAERVLAIDELRAFVDALPPGNPASDGRWRIDEVTMRGIVARRLMRAERFDEAVPYFASRHRRHAIAYGAAIVRARGAGDEIARAESLYDASLIARRHGLEILGTAHGPDWEHHHADYDLSEYTVADDPGPWFTAAEEARLADTALAMPQRYHYRHVASALAERAADLLPPQSHAFAATLCTSARHIRYVDEDRFESLWWRYTDEGPIVDFASSFGHDCPRPEFERARRFLPVPPAPAWQLVLTAVLSALGAVWLWRRLRPRVIPHP